jgi:hypothetical protein
MTEFVLTPEQRISEAEKQIIANPEIAGIQAYEYLRSDAASQKAAFIDGSRADLQLAYPNLGTLHLSDLAGDTQLALRTLMPAHDEKSGALYNAVEYRFTEIALLGLACEMNDESLPESEHQEVTKWFTQTNEALYGKPDAEVFAGLARDNLNVHTQKPLDEEQVKARQMQLEIEEILGEIQETTYAPFRPEQTTVDRIKLLVIERLGFLIEHIEEDKIYDVTDMKQALDIALGKMHGQELGWSVEIVEDSSVLSVSAHQRLIEVGKDRDDIDGLELKGKILHELGVHTLRSINAEKAGWLSAAYGQEGYLDFEEAFGTALEDAYRGEYGDSGVDYYLIAGLAYGYDNHEPRAFREVYEIMWRKHALQNLEGNQDLTEQQVDDAQSKAFNQCLRLFRGTKTTEPGIIYLKDLSYYSGQERVWSVLSTVESQEDLDPLFAGKLDLTNPYHQHIAQQILAA